MVEPKRQNQSRDALGIYELERKYEHALRKSWKHRAIGAALLACTAFGGLQGIKHISGIGEDGDNKKLGLAWLLVATGAFVGTVAAGFRINRDQNNLERRRGSLEGAQAPNINLPPIRERSKHKRSAYQPGETCGHAELRHRVSAICHLSGASVSTVAGAYMLNKGLGDISTMTGVFNAVVGVVQFVVAPVLVSDGLRHRRMLRDVQKDISRSGFDATVDEMRAKRKSGQELSTPNLR